MSSPDSPRKPDPPDAAVKEVSTGGLLQIGGGWQRPAQRDERPTTSYPAIDAAPPSGTTRLRLSISGMHCAACVSHVEAALRRVPGVAAAAVHLATGEAVVDGERELSPTRLIDAVRGAGYGARPVETVSESARASQQLLEQERRRWLVRLGTAAVGLGVLLLVGGMHVHGASLSPARAWLLGVTATLVQLVVGGPYWVGAWRRLRSGGASMDTLIAVGTGAGWLAGIDNLTGGRVLGVGGGGMALADGAMILLFVTLGKYLEVRARSRASRAVHALLDLLPVRARVRRDGEWREVAVEEVQVGERVQVGAGARVPLDGDIVEGESELDESWLTGESLPVPRRVGERVLAGTINGGGVLVVQAVQGAGSTSLARIAALVRETQESRADVQRLADRATAWFVPAVLVVAAITGSVWWLAGEPRQAVESLVAVLIVACPCALGLATPMAVLVASGRGAELGILFKSAATMERTAQVDQVLLDKTGTLTTGRPRVNRIVPIEEPRNDLRDENELLRWAASLVAGSSHPISRAIAEAASVRGLAPLTEVSEVQETPGQGVSGNVAGRRVCVGNERLLAAAGISGGPRDSGLEGTLVWLGVAGQAVAQLELVDQVPETSLAAIKALRELGLSTTLLSGDREPVVAAAARESGAQEYRAGLTPAEKLAVIREAQQAGRIVAMVGDGVNDGPALAAADVGIAMGRGADVAVEAADVVLTGDDLGHVPRAIQLARSTTSIIRQNLLWAVGYNLVLIPLAAGVLVPWTGWGLPPVAASIAMAASSVSVVTNSLRIRRQG